jgi:hypothetical protein
MKSMKMMNGMNMDWNKLEQCIECDYLLPCLGRIYR